MCRDDVRDFLKMVQEYRRKQRNDGSSVRGEELYDLTSDPVVRFMRRVCETVTTDEMKKT